MTVKDDRSLQELREALKRNGEMLEEERRNPSKFVRETYFNGTVRSLRVVRGKETLRNG